ncbi:MAG: type II toxin-antitoxin system RelE/ParE family toxin [Solirubrobacterales bacterium]
MAQTQAVYYRDQRGSEPVDEFNEALPAKRAAKIDDYVEEYLNGKPPDSPPPQFPVTSQIEGELRELRVRFANTRYRILYQRSENLIVLLHAIERAPGRCLAPTSSWRNDGWTTSSAAWTRSAGRRRARRVKMRRPGAEEGDRLPYRNR